ncbi:MAG TPA: hypothetical protein VIM30_16265 [Candidatus Limnocylindrales bacterium]|jgi:hypothetical protein
MGRRRRWVSLDREGHRFIVKGTCGPLRDGELELARQWGAELAQMVKSD